MNKYFLLFTLFLFQCAHAQLKFNGNIEDINPATKKAVGWTYGFDPQMIKAYPVELDSTIKHNGKYSLSIKQVGSESQYGVIDYIIPQQFEGKRLELRGYMKTQDVANGYAGLWLRLDGQNGMLAIDNMANQKVDGTTDWKQYTIQMAYDPKITSLIHIGGLLAGNGKAWFDGFELLIDGKPIEIAKQAIIVAKKADTDTSFSKGSRINSIAITPQQITNLTLAGQFWGFLKYHHPAIAKGDYNWDAELFRFLPDVIASKNNTELSAALEKYLDLLPVPAKCKNCDVKIEAEAIKPDYGSLLTGTFLSKSLTAKLEYIKNNRNTGGNYYIGTGSVGNPDFTNERAYRTMTYPDAGYRLLSLYRYWAMINYYFPYKDVIGKDWNKILSDYIPSFVAAKDSKEYTSTTLGLIAEVHDTHANIWGGNSTLTTIKGIYAAPFQAKFIEGSLVITGFYVDSLATKSNLHIGDVITAINGKNIAELIKNYLPITAASNYDTQLRDLPRDYLLRSNEKMLSFTIQHKDKSIEVSLPLISYTLTYRNLDYTKSTSYELLNDEIGYVYPGKYKNQQLPEIKEAFKNTKGIVVDMRCYPSEFMPFTFGNYIKSIQSPFVKFTRMNLSKPGSFSYMQPLSNGGANGYKGKVVVIVNATSQSQAEYTTMAFQSSPNVK
jgi:hypothetical protein